MTRVRHTVNGRFNGIWYETEAGTKIYLAHRTRRDIDFKFNAWRLNVSLLEKAKAEGFAVGVIYRHAGQVLTYLTNPDDFFTNPDSFACFDQARQRGLPLNQFRVDPTKSARQITVACKLR